MLLNIFLSCVMALLYFLSGVNKYSCFKIPNDVVPSNVFWELFSLYVYKSVDNVTCLLYMGHHLSGCFSDMS